MPRSVTKASTKKLWLLCVVLISLSPAPSWAIDLDTIALEGAKGASQIGSIEFELSSHEKYDYLCYWDGGNYRVESWEKGADRSRSNPGRIVTFDGSKHYLLDHNQLFVGSTPRVRKPFPMTHNPLFVMYYWLFAAKNTYAWSVACNAKAWKEVLSKGKYVGESDVDGVTCYQVRLEFPTRQTDVWFARDFGCFPMRWVCKVRENGKLASEAKVTRYKLIDTEQGKVFIPLASSFFQPGDSKHSNKIDRAAGIVESSLKVNQGVDKDLFKLAPPRSGHIVDTDQPRERPLPQRADLDQSPGHARMWLMGLSALLLLIFLTVVILKRRHA